MRYLPAIVEPISGSFAFCLAGASCVISPGTSMPHVLQKRAESAIELYSESRSSIVLKSLSFETLRFWCPRKIQQSPSSNNYTTEQRCVRAKGIVEHLLCDHAESIPVELLIEIEVLVENNQRTDAAGK